MLLVRLEERGVSCVCVAWPHSRMVTDIVFSDDHYLMTDDTFMCVPRTENKRKKGISLITF